MKNSFFICLCCVFFAQPLFAQNPQNEVITLVNNHDAKFVYRDCVNEVYFLLPEKHAGKVWTYKANQGTVTLKKHTKGYDLLEIVPSQVGMITITAQTGDITQTFDLKSNPVPPPHISLESAGKEINLKDPIEFTSAIQIVAKADGTFQHTVPQEAQYRVDNLSAIVFRGGRNIGTIRSTDGQLRKEDINFNSDVKSKKIEEGDAIQITIERVSRLNSQSRYSEVKVPQPFVAFFLK